jgi:NADH:ubiquinone oxidoreductase subunit K
MGKVLSILMGLILMALGVWGIIAWRADVVAFIKAAVVIMAVLIGLGIFVFGVSELRAGDEQPTVDAPAPPPEQPTVPSA